MTTTIPRIAVEMTERDWQMALSGIAALRLGAEVLEPVELVGRVVDPRDIGSVLAVLRARLASRHASRQRPVEDPA